MLSLLTLGPWEGVVVVIISLGVMISGFFAVVVVIRTVTLGVVVGFRVVGGGVVSAPLLDFEGRRSVTFSVWRESQP